MKKRSKILLYNWIQFDNVNGVGGGVTVYVRNLIEAFLKYRKDVDIVFLSSGWAYDTSNTKCYFRQTKNIFGKKIKTFEIVNSPVPAYQKFILNNIAVSFENKNFTKCFVDFLNQEEFFDVIHFHNIEGLSLDCFKGLKQYANKVFYSMHNYVPICPSGFYFKRKENKICDKNHSGQDCSDCASCLAIKDPIKGIISRRINKTSNVNNDFWIKETGVNLILKPGLTENYIIYSEKVKTIIENMDGILAVSKKVKDIAMENGISENKIIVSYIGTKVAKIAKKYSRKFKLNNSPILNIVFLGTNLGNYEKGYPFLFKSLKMLPKEYKNKIRLTLNTTEKGKDDWVKKELEDFADVIIIHGYTHKNLKHILKNQDLGLVPVLWEDNLPQIAIEMQSYGVPVLSSSFGGASELCSNSNFVFLGGDSTDFNNHIIHFVDRKTDLSLFWKYNISPVTMKEHLKQIGDIYGI